jgi:L-methionine (R)-S-oxide reductase
MAETIFIDTALPKSERYEQLFTQWKALVGNERNEIAVLANTAAALHEVLGHFWTGFYMVHEDELVLGPFQGPVACSRIGRGKGVCGSAWQQKQTIVVADVELFPGHIACSSLSRSEIVVPLLHPSGAVMGVLDIDSKYLASFDQVDQHYLELICASLSEILYRI